MINKKIIIFAFIGIIGFAFIVTIPIGALLVNFSSYQAIYESRSYEYVPNDSSENENLILNIEYGNIKINYIDPPVDYLVKIDLDISMGGAGLAGKDYSDYFNIIEGDLNSSPINFTIKLSPRITLSELESLVKEVSILITIQKGVVFDIFANVTDGDIIIEVPFRAKIKNMHFYITTGNIFYDLNNCIILGNITGIIDNGRITLMSNNAEYPQNSIWTLFANKSSIEIIQDNIMRANVTGSITTTALFGTLLIYKDKTSEVGAKFTLYNYNFVQFPNGTSLNFDYDIVGINECTYKSTDFPANNNYIFWLFLGGMLYHDLYNT